MNCIVCNKKLLAFDDNNFHPIGGVHFFSYGHYGTTVFDPMDGSTLNIFVCDQCLNTKKELTKTKKYNRINSNLEDDE